MFIEDVIDLEHSADALIDRALEKYLICIREYGEQGFPHRAQRLQEITKLLNEAIM